MVPNSATRAWAAVLVVLVCGQSRTRNFKLVDRP